MSDHCVHSHRTVIGLTTYCILTIEQLQLVSLLRWGPQLNSMLLKEVSKTLYIVRNVDKHIRSDSDPILAI